MQKQWSYIAMVVFACSFSAIHIARAEVLDRVIATVNDHVILLSDLDDELRFESFTSGRKLIDITAEETKAALDRLIEQELLKEQVGTSEPKAISADQVRQQIESMKNDYVREHPGKIWDTGLRQYGLTEKSIHSHLTTELNELQFIDARFRPSIQISQWDIEQYYKKELVPKLPASGPVSLSDVTPKIREVLIQNKISEMLSSWLQTVRSQAQIRILSPVPNSYLMSPQSGAQ
jgi:hypothetical protein